jgi:hypothetical protein
MTTALYGVATSVYGSGMQITDKFDTFHEAQKFAGRFLPGAGVVCQFSDGRWRSVAPVTAFLECPTTRVIGMDSGDLCADCGHAYGKHTVTQVRA